MHLLYCSNNFLKAPMEVLLCQRVNDIRHSLFHFLNCLITTTLELREWPKVTGSKVWTIGKLRNCPDANFDQIVCDNDGIVHWCTAGNATNRIWRVLASSDGISSWTPFKHLHNNPNPSPSPLVNQLWCIDFRTPPTPLIIPHRLPVFLESLMPLKNWCLIHARLLKSSLKYSIRFCGIFSSLKQNFIAYRSSKVFSCPDCIFEDHQLWHSGFSSVYSKYYCSRSFEPEIIKIGRSSHKMYNNNILHYQVSSTILNAWTKNSGNLLNAPRILGNSWCMIKIDTVAFINKFITGIKISFI